MVGRMRATSLPSSLPFPSPPPQPRSISRDVEMSVVHHGGAVVRVSTNNAASATGSLHDGADDDKEADGSPRGGADDDDEEEDERAVFDATQRAPAGGVRRTRTARISSRRRSSAPCTCAGWSRWANSCTAAPPRSGFPRRLRSSLGPCAWLAWRWGGGGESTERAAGRRWQRVGNLHWRLRRRRR